MRKPQKPPQNKTPDFKEFESIHLNHDLFSKLMEVEKSYPYWEDFKYKAKVIIKESNSNLSPEALWRFIKFGRENNYSKLLFLNRADFKFKYSTNGNILKSLHKFDLNLGGNLQGSDIIPSQDKNRFLISSIMEEAIASSQLEGAITTREVAKEMLRTERKPVNVSEKMILNNYLTIKRILEIKDKKLTKELILEIHALISKGTLGNAEQEGKFRTNNNVKVVDNITGEVYYDPPSHEIIEEIMEIFCDFANSTTDEDFIHPIIRSIVLHFLIGYIHPFVDGNGRTARAIFYWFLISKGYWLMEYLSVSRIIIKSPSQYPRAYLFTEYDENDLTYFIDFNLKAMNSAMKELREYISRKIREKNAVFSIFKHDKDLNERQTEIVKDLVYDTQKTISINQIKSKFNVVYQTARTDLAGLVNAGYLQGKMVGKKFVYFPADGFWEKLKEMNVDVF